MKKLTHFVLSAVLAVTAFGPQVFASFPDVSDNLLTADAIYYLQDKGTVEGYPSGNYEPDHRIRRVEMMKIVAKELYSDEEIAACDINQLSFPDWDSTQWYAPFVCILVENGIITGNDDGTLDPGGYTNFAEISKILAEANGIEGSAEGTGGEWFAGYVKGLEEKNVIPSTIGYFDQDVNRSEMAEMSYRISAGVEDKVGVTYEEIVDPLPNISSCDALQEKFHDYQYPTPYPLLPRTGGGFDDVDEAVMVDMAETGMGAGAEGDLAVPAEPVAAATNQLKTNDYSETNVQVEGVDEADIIKNDGEFIYLLKGDTVRIVRANPVDEMEEIQQIDFNEDGDGEGFYPREMFISGDQLVVMGQVNYRYYYDEPIPVEPGIATEPALLPPYRGSKMKVYVLDLSTDRRSSEISRQVVFDGDYFTSRRIGNQLYLVMNLYPYSWYWDGVKTGTDLLPMMQDGDDVAETMVSCEDVRYFPGHNEPNYLIVASMDITNPNSSIPREVTLGSGQNVYSSATDLYVANTFVDYDYFSDWDWRFDEAKSHIYRFELNGGDLEFRSRGEVPGRSLNQFSMDQHDGYFRIATTTGDIWNDMNPSENNVYVLGADMSRVGELEGLAPGEEIKSTRFLGDRLYMVTFEQVDPLFVIDMENPRSPKVLGSLKIPGFSEYLHPYDENHIIGFGQETSVEKDNVLLDGFKMSLFDVSDVTNPQQKFVERIGDRGTYSELLYNHKALLFDKERGLMSFPISIVEKMTPQDLQCGNYTVDECPAGCMEAWVSDGECVEDSEGNVSCDSGGDDVLSCVAPTYDQYETTFSGAVVYDIDLDDGFAERGRISHVTEEEKLKYGMEWPYFYGNSIQRIVRIGEVLYTVAQGGVKASDIETIDELNFVELEGDEDEFYPVPFLEGDMVVEDVIEEPVF